MINPNRGRLTDPAEMLAFVTGGKAFFTLLNTVSGKRFTFRVAQPKKSRDNKPAPFFVKLLTGSDNYNNYTFFGTIFGGKRFVYSRKSKLGHDTIGILGFEWLWKRVINGHALPDTVEFWHEGKCCVCSRKLTVPRSIAIGIGPVCSGGIKFVTRAKSPKSKQLEMQLTVKKGPIPGPRRHFHFLHLMKRLELPPTATS